MVAMAWEPSGNFVSRRAVFLRETAGEQGAEALGAWWGEVGERAVEWKTLFGLVC